MEQKVVTRIGKQLLRSYKDWVDQNVLATTFMDCMSMVVTGIEKKDVWKTCLLEGTV